MKRLACVLGLGIALVAVGCGGGGAGGIPKQFAGTYKVTIASGGKTDNDTMSISEGVNSTVLLDFVYGISQIRALVMGQTQIKIVEQTLHVSHSTGAADGVGTGMGTVAVDGTVGIELDLVTSGLGSGGDGGSGGAVVYQIMGTKI